MRKTLSAIIALVLLTTIVLGGCSASSKSAYEKLDLSKYVKVGQYMDIAVEKKYTKVTPEDVAIAVKDCLYDGDYYTLGEPVTDRAVKTDDYLTVDIVGTIDGKPFEGGSESNYVMVTGINYFATWNDYLMGAKLNETVKVQLAVPPNNNEYGDVSGKKIIYQITIKKIQPINYSELTEAVISDLSGYSTVEELEKFLKNNIAKSRLDEKMDVVWKKVMENSEILDYPQDMMKEYNKKYYDLNKKYIDESTISFDEYLKNTSKTEQSFKTEAEEYAKECVGEELVCYFIAKEQKIEITDVEYNNGLSDYYEKNKKDYSSKAEFEKDMGKSNIRNKILISKVKTYVSNSAVAAD